jgi:hypothetical protein
MPGAAGVDLSGLLINSTYIWIGHADDHRAWSQLTMLVASDAPPPGLAEGTGAGA